MFSIRIAFALVCLAPAVALAEIGPQARELLELNRQMAEFSCQRARIRLDMSGAASLGQGERVEALKLEMKALDEDPANIGRTKRGKELAGYPFNADEKKALNDQIGKFKKGCQYLVPK
jgi:hypothetical protein